MTARQHAQGRSLSLLFIDDREKLAPFRLYFKRFVPPLVSISLPISSTSYTQTAFAFVSRCILSNRHARLVTFITHFLHPETVSLFGRIIFSCLSSFLTHVPKKSIPRLCGFQTRIHLFEFSGIFALTKENSDIVA